MAKDVGIVTIYDTKNDMAPLTTHRIDAKEFLSHPSGRWSASPEVKKSAIGEATPKDTGEDSGKAMRLKAMDFKALRAMANKAGITDYLKMDKAALVDALEAQQ